MIKTSLLPSNIQKQKKARKRAVASGPATSSDGGGGLFALLMLACILFFGGVILGSAYFMYAESAKAEQAARKMEVEEKNKKEAYENQYAQFRDQLNEYNEMKSKEEILNVLMPENRLIWAEKLNMLANLTPDEVFITDIKVTEQIVMQETVASIRARSQWDAKKEEFDRNKALGVNIELGPRPRPITKPIITHSMEISAITPYDELTKLHSRRVVVFREALHNYAEPGKDGQMRYFREHFELNEAGQISVDTPKQERVTVDGQEVWSFKLGIVTEPFVEKENNNQ